MKKSVILVIILVIVIICFFAITIDLHTKINHLSKKVTFIEDQIQTSTIYRTKSDLSFIVPLAGVAATLLTFIILHKNNKDIQLKQEQTERIAIQPFIMGISINPEESKDMVNMGVININLRDNDVDIEDLVGEHENPKEKLLNHSTKCYTTVIGFKNVGKDVAVNTYISLVRIGTIENGNNNSGRYKVLKPEEFVIAQFVDTNSILPLTFKLVLSEKIHHLRFLIEYQDKTQKRKYKNEIHLSRYQGQFIIQTMPSSIRMFEYKNNQWKEKYQ